MKKIISVFTLGTILALSSLVVTSVSWADDLLDIINSQEEVEELELGKSTLTNSIRAKLKRITAEQNIFFSFLDKNEFEKALYQWQAAFAKESFGQSPTGRALYSYLLLKNNLKVFAVENLFSIRQPGRIDKELVLLWRVELASDHPVWKRASIQWSPRWGKVFSTEVEVIVRAKSINDAKNYNNLLSLLKKSKLKSETREWLEWQIALNLELQGQSKKAAKVLSHLLKTRKTKVVDQNLVLLTVARILYGRGFLRPSIKYYSKMPKSSEYWFVAQEEISWAYLRLGEPQNAMAHTKTLLVPAFSVHVGPETVFVDSLAHLKVCDYANVVKSITAYRDRFRPRAMSLMHLAKNIKNAHTDYLMDQMGQGRIKLLELGEHAKSLPQYVSRDEALYQLAQNERALSLEAQTFSKLYSQSISKSSATIGYQAYFENLKREIEGRARKSRNGFYNRVKVLGNEEIKSIHQILQKMHIVEAEVIQQVAQVQKNMKDYSQVKSEEQKGSTGSKNKYAMSFPFEGEVWFDELSNYKVDINKGCSVTN